MSAADGNVWRDATADDGGGLPTAQRRSLPVLPQRVTVVGPWGGRYVAVPHVDMTGERVGSLVVRSRAADAVDGSPRWTCACDCGRETTVAHKRLRSAGGPTACQVCMRAAAVKARSETLARQRDGLAPHARRGRTWSMRRQSVRALARMAAASAATLAEHQRPVTRGDCLAGGVNAQRPCPWAGCAHHLALVVEARNGNVKVLFPDAEGEPDLAAMLATCALDVTDDADASPAGGETLESIGALMGLTRERIRQIEDDALWHARGPAVDAGQHEHLDETPDGPHLYGRPTGGRAALVSVSESVRGESFSLARRGAR